MPKFPLLSSRKKNNNICQPLMNDLHGIINLNKPTGITSAKALYRVRKTTRQKKSGHAGTLDPGATGVLVLCNGKATKLVESIMDQPKVYRATARLDITSDSFDSDNPIRPVDTPEIPDQDMLIQACKSFEGEIQQTPPKISAIKIGGLPAYKRVMQDETFVLKPRAVHIYWIHVHRYDWPEIDFELACGRGTYIRSFIRDLGKKLNTGGCLTSLARTQVGPFMQENGWTFESLEAANGPEEYLIDMERLKELLDPNHIKIPEAPRSE